MFGFGKKDEPSTDEQFAQMSVEKMAAEIKRVFLPIIDSIKGILKDRVNNSQSNNEQLENLKILLFSCNNAKKKAVIYE